MPDVSIISLLEHINMASGTLCWLADAFISIPVKEREQMHVNNTDIYSLDQG